MAENTGKTTGSMIAAIQSAQKAVGSAITGGAAATVGADNGSLSVLEDLRSIGRENEKNTQSLLDTMKSMFVFDKDAFRRERDQARELAKEKNLAASNSSVALPTKSEATGDFGVKGIAAIGALALFAKSIGVEDVLRLPQQIKSIMSMATFAKGVGTIATLGFGPTIVSNMKAAIKSISLNPKEIKLLNTNLSGGVKNFFRPITDIFERMRLNVKLFTMEMRAPMQTFRKAVDDGRKMLKPIVDSFKAAFANVKAVFMPIINTVKGLFGTGGSFAKTLDTILGPLKTVGKFIGRLFLPITLILGVIDGVQGFMKEFGETGSIVDGIRGAIVGIVDGFIGSFVRLITGLVGKVLEFFGLDNLGAMVANLGESLTGSFGQALGGIVDVITGIFTLDFDRILGGFGSLFKGAGSFFLEVLTAPINMAVNFIKDIFGFGDPDKPFNLKDMILGTVKSIGDWFTGLFTIDFKSLKDKIFSIGTMMKALAAGGLAAAGAMLPGGESPGEAFSRKFNEVMKGGSGNVVNEGDEIKKITNENVKGDTTETTYKTNTINQGAESKGDTIIYTDNSNKQQSTTNNSKSDTYTGSLSVSQDPYHDRMNFAFGSA